YKHVQWTSQAEVFQVHTVVLSLTLFVSLMIFIFDFGFTRVMDRLSSNVKSLFR
ncbi:preprotein translocase subunit SecE, partial [Streptobacillus moniliformis]|uniref:preprotein translocase subunit SecE n=1 Tax=Streptobacillus moniliformis TaxID=34105 RepID=UPI0007E4C1B0